MEFLDLPNGDKMPIVGLGTWQAPKDEIKAAVKTALEVGYRHFDCALAYENEEWVGEAFQEWFDSGKGKREDLFITTKLWCTHVRPGGDVRKCCDESLRRLKTGYVDLYLIHHSVTMKDPKDNFQTIVYKDDAGNILFEDVDLMAVWKDMEELQKAGLARSVGVSNFNEEQLQRICDITSVPLANHQVELNAYLSQEKLVEFCQSRGVTMVAYAPLGAPGRPVAMHNNDTRPNLLDDAVVKRVAEKHGKTAGQVCLRYLTQLKIAVIPKSVKPERIAQNFDIFSFKLDDEDMAALKAINKDLRNFDLQFFPGAEKMTEYPFLTR